MNETQKPLFYADKSWTEAYKSTLDYAIKRNKLTYARLLQQMLKQDLREMTFAKGAGQEGDQNDDEEEEKKEGKFKLMNYSPICKECCD